MFNQLMFIMLSWYNPVLNKPWFLHVCSTSFFENNVGKGETDHYEQFLLFSQRFLAIWRTFFHFHQIWNCRLQTFSVWKSPKFVLWERVKGFSGGGALTSRNTVHLVLYLNLKHCTLQLQGCHLAHYEWFLLFLQCFWKTCTADTLKQGLVWERVNWISVVIFNKTIHVLERYNSFPNNKF